MRSNHAIVPIAACAAAVLGFTFIANSGDLNPPAGAVSPTGRTLVEVYDAAVIAGTASGNEPVADVRLPMSLTLSGSATGQIDGEDTLFGMTDVIRCFGYTHNVSYPVDGSGIPQGARQHGPLIIHKQIDKATPLLNQAFATADNIDSFTLRVYRDDPMMGGVQQYYTIELINAFVIGIRNDNESVANNSFTHDEFVSFGYQQIVWTYEPESITATDDNNPPVR